MKQVNREGYEQRTTEIMLNKPITSLSRFIVAKWYSTLEQLSLRSGVSLGTIQKAVSGEKVSQRIEKKIRDFLENY